MLFLVDKTVSDEVTCELVTTNVVTSNIPTLAEFRTRHPQGEKKILRKKKKKGCHSLLFSGRVT